MLRVLFLLISFVVFSFADDITIFSVVSDKLTEIGHFVVSILSAVIIIRLIPFTWDSVKTVLFREGTEDISSGTIVSNSKSRREAKDRLYNSKNASSRWIVNSISQEESSRFRSRFPTYEDYQGSFSSSFHSDGTLKKGRLKDEL